MDYTAYSTTPCRSRSILKTAILSNQKLCTNLWQPSVTDERARREVVYRWVSKQLQHQLYKEQRTLPDACTLLSDHTLSIHPLHRSCLWTRMQRRAARQVKATNSYKIKPFYHLSGETKIGLQLAVSGSAPSDDSKVNIFVCLVFWLRSNEPLCGSQVQSEILYTHTHSHWV